MPCATNSSTKTLPDPKGHAEGPSSSARLIWGCWCRLRRSFSNSVHLSNLPPYSAFWAFLCRAPRGGARGCRRSLAERSVKYPSYTNFTDRRPGAGLLIQTNRRATSALPVRESRSCRTERRREGIARSAVHACRALRRALFSVNSRESTALAAEHVDATAAPAKKP